MERVTPRAILPGPLEMAFHVAGREIRDQLRDWRILTPIIVLTLFFPILMNFTAREAVGFVTRYGAPIVGDRLIPFLLMVVGFFPISISLVIALESFAGERERLSLEPLLATPLTDGQLYLGKLLASLASPLGAAYLGISVYLIGVMLAMGWRPPVVLLVQVLLLTTAQAIVMVCGAVVISSQTTSVRAANLLASFIIVPVSQLVIGESIIMFWGRYSILWWVILGLLLIALVLSRMGLHLFNREELLGREIDVVDLRWAWKVFADSFTDGATSVAEWYRKLIRSTAARLLPSIAITALILAWGYAIGAGLAKQFTLPGTWVTFDRLRGGLGEAFKQVGLLTPGGWLWVIWNNVRAVGIASFLGMFTFGALALVLLMIPFAIIGYFAGNVALAGGSPLTFLVALVLPHAILEVPAAVLAGAAVVQIGLSLISPPEGHSLGERWLRAVGLWAKVCVGLVLPMLVLAAAIEVFVTPRVALLILSGS
jgi:uncharacterized membrane protein SpoIIM required for sporulation/ABC-type transport system involved in multi-copper enzyme maturation permease subunit